MTTFGYTGGLLSSIATAGRTVVIDTVATIDNDVVPFEPIPGLTPPDGPPVRADQASAELRGISEDGRLRSFTYTDGKLHTVTNHAGASGNNLITTVGYDAAGLAQSVDFGGSLYTVVPVAAVGLRPGTALLAPSTARVIDPAGLVGLDADGNEVNHNYVRATEVTLDEHGRSLGSVAGTLTIPFALNQPFDNELSRQSVRRNAYGDVYQATDALGRVTTTTYDYYNAPRDQEVFGNVTEIFRDYVVAAYDYTSDTGLVQTMTDSRGAVTTYTYVPGTDLVIQVDGPEGISESFTYDASALPQTHTDARGLVTTYTYGANRNVATATTAADPVTGQRMRTQYTYDANGNLDLTTASYDSGSGFVQRSETDDDIDAFGRLLRTVIRDASGDKLNEVAYQYHDNNLLYTVTTTLSDDSTALDNEAFTLYQYNGRGQVIGQFVRDRYEDLDDGLVGSMNGSLNTVYDYYPDGRLEQITSPDGSISRNYFDPTTFTTWTTQNSVASNFGITTDRITKTVGDAAGRVISTVDLLSGAASTYGYDRFDRQTSSVNQYVTEEGGDRRQSITTTAFDATGNVVGSKLSDLAGTFTVYDLAGRSVATGVATDGGELNWTSYNVASDIIASTEFRQIPNSSGAYDSATFFTTMTHDGFGRILTVTDPESVTPGGSLGVTTYAYSIDNGSADPALIGLAKTTVIDRNGVLSSSFADAMGRTVRAIDPSGAVSTSGFDIGGRLVSTRFVDTDPSRQLIDRSTSRFYDAASRMRRSDSESGTLLETTRTNYTLGGGQTIVASIDVNGAISLATYDSENNIVRINGADPGNGNPSLTEYAYLYNASAGTTRTTLRESISGSATRTSSSVSNAFGTMLASYGDDGLLIEANRLDLAGRPILQIDADGDVTALTYDLATGQVIREVSTDGETIAYAFDSSGNMVALTDGSGSVTYWSHDGLGRMTDEVTLREQLNAAGVRIGLDEDRTSYVYDGLTVTETRRDGVQVATTQSLDGLTTSVVKTLVGGATEFQSVARNSDGTLREVSDESGSLSWTYDSLGRVDQVTQTVNALGVVYTSVIDSDHDAFGRMDAFTLSVGGAIALTQGYTLDELGRATTITQSGASVADKTARFSFRTDGRLESIQRGFSVSSASDPLSFLTENTFDGENRISRIAHNAPGRMTDPIAAYDYRYDAQHRIESIDQAFAWLGSDRDRSDSYTYDNRDQLDLHLVNLDGVDLPAAAEGQADGELGANFTFDASGNRIGDGEVIGTGNRLLRDADYIYGYDPEGRRTSRTSLFNNSVTFYTFDGDGYLVAVDHGDSLGNPLWRVEYAYDGLDRRIARREWTADAGGTLVITSQTGYIWRDDHVIAETNAAGQLTRTYFLAPGTDQILSVEDIDPATSVTQTYWTFQDHLGSVRSVAAINPDDSLSIGHIDFGAFGESGTPYGDSPSLLESVGIRYAGREIDATTGLSYNRARYYDPNAGLFISEDPIGFQAGDQNISRYTENNPINRVDPTGFAGDGHHLVPQSLWTYFSDTVKDVFDDNLKNQTNQRFGARI